MARNTKKDSSKTREPKAPAYIAYHIVDKRQDDFWTRIGAAWNHDDGKGFTLSLELIPVSGGRIVLRKPPEPEERGA